MEEIKDIRRCSRTRIPVERLGDQVQKERGSRISIRIIHRKKSKNQQLDIDEKVARYRKRKSVEKIKTVSTIEQSGSSDISKEDNYSSKKGKNSSNSSQDNWKHRLDDVELRTLQKIDAFYRNVIDRHELVIKKV